MKWSCTTGYPIEFAMGMARADGDVAMHACPHLRIDNTHKVNYCQDCGAVQSAQGDWFFLTKEVTGGLDNDSSDGGGSSGVIMARRRLDAE